MSSSSFLFRCSRLVGRVPLSSVSASPSSAAVASSSFLPNDSFLLPNSKRCWQCPSPRRRSQSYSVAAAAAVYATPQDSRHYKQHPLQSRRRGIATTIDDDDMDLEETLLPPREQMAFDVLIVGGGPAGLAAAIRIKQMCQQQGDNTDLSVCVIDKGRYVRNGMNE